MTERTSGVSLMLGDCLERLRELPDNSVDSVVTDPPYGLSFMGKKWDYDVPSVEVWAECLRVLKPGGHLLAFAGTRTQHRMAVKIEDAGFEIRDMIAWVYGSGFPKSLDVSKAIDKAAGAEREVVGSTITKDIRRNVAADIAAGKTDRQGKFAPGSPSMTMEHFITAPATHAARQWSGWGTALKPALEPITVARKPLGEKTVAANVLKHGTGAINVDGCRVGTTVETWPKSRQCRPAEFVREHNCETQSTDDAPAGRWPANLIHDGSDDVVGLFPKSKSPSGVSYRHASNNLAMSGANTERGFSSNGHGDTGSAARFFYCAKASKSDRNEGCGHLPDKEWAADGACVPERDRRPFNPSKNNHPTVKPTDLMRYLCRLVTPPGGVVLDPFMGSGSTGKAAIREGFQFVGIERDAEYMKIAESRIATATNQCA
jgi:DNA modification methylase